jgi:hypothetical protein
MKRLDLWTPEDYRVDASNKILIKVYDEQMNCDTYIPIDKLEEMAIKEEITDTDFYKNFKTELAKITENTKKRNTSDWEREVEFIEGTKYRFMREKYACGERSDWYLFTWVGPKDYDKRKASWIIDTSVINRADEVDVFDVVLGDDYNSCVFQTTLGRVKSGIKENGKTYVPLRYFEIQQFNENKYPNYL